LVWITMLSMADQLGRIHAAIPGLAHRARVSLKATEEALELFLQPDPYSRSKDHDGRRIEVIDGGWRLLNYGTYRELRDEEARKEQNRIAQSNYRKKVSQIVSNPADSKQASASVSRVSQSKPASAQEEVEEEVEVESTKTTTLASTAIAVPAARGKLVCTLPLNQGDHEVFEADVQEWVPLYPAVDIRQELRNMKGWLLGNPKLRKTKTGIGRFINAWFSRAQNESRPGAGNGTFNRSHGKTGGNLDALATTLALIDQRDQQAANEVCGAETGTGEPIDTFDLRGRSSELSAGGYRSGVTLDLIPPPR
jgi:hypothetical protein